MWLLRHPICPLRALQGTPASELRVHPQPLTPLYLAQRCAPEVDEATSRAVYEAFK